MDSRQKTKGEQNEYRILIAQDVECLRLFGVKDLNGEIAETNTNLQYGWNGFILRKKGFQYYPQTSNPETSMRATVIV